MSLRVGTDNPVLQVALDKTDFTEVLKLAKKAVDGGADWLEAGTPLIKSVGMTAIKRAKEKFPNMIIVAEMKPLDTGRLELQMAFEAGADIVIITELAPTSTIEECIYTAQSLNRKLIMEKAAIRKLHSRSSCQTVPLRDFKDCLTKMPKKSRLVSSLEIKEEGLKVVKRLKELFPVVPIVADIKAISNVDREFVLAFEAGADIVSVVAAAGLENIRKAVRVAKDYGRQVMVDLIGIRDHFGEDAALKLARKIEGIGAHYLCYHIPIDDQMRGKRILSQSVGKIANELNIPLAVAGGIDVHSASTCAQAGAKVIIVGGTITKAKNPLEVTQHIKKAITPIYPVLQIALDVCDLKKAVEIAKQVAPYVDWLEVGSILATSAGIEAVKRLKKLFPHKVIVEDLKVVDFGAEEAELAAQAGADIIGLWGAARNSTILTTIKKAKESGLKVMIDVGQEEPLESIKIRAKELEAMGADYIVYLIPKDEQAIGKKVSPVTVSALSNVLSVPLAVAGGLDARSGPKAVKAGAKIVIAGEAVYKSDDPRNAAKRIKKAIDKMGAVHAPVRLSCSEIIKETVNILIRHITEVALRLEEKKTEQFLKVLTSAHRIIIAGMGRSRIVGRLAKNWLNKLGVDVKVIEMGDEDVPSDFSHKLGDILMPISASGKTPSIVDYSTTLREKGEGTVMVLPITATPHAPAWHKGDLILVVQGRTKEHWLKEKEGVVGQRVPLGTISEFATLIFLLSVTQAIMEGELKTVRVREVVLKMAQELENSLSYIERQKETLEKVVEAILDTKWRGSRVVLDGFGRVDRINCMFAARLIQVYGLNPMILRGDIGAKIRGIDTVIISSLSGEILQTFKTVSHCVRDKGLIPIYFTGLGDSPASRLIRKGRIVEMGKTIVQGKVLGVFVPGTVVRRGRLVSFSERQFIENGKKKITPLDETTEVVLLAIFEGIFACIMDRLGLKETNLEHAELE